MVTKSFDEAGQSDKEQILNHDVLDALSEFIGSDPFGNYLVEFVDNTVKNIERIGMAVASNDDERVRHLAHKLKGSSGNIGALKLAWNCVQLEATTVEENSQELMHQRYDELQSTFKDTRFAIESYIKKLSVSQSYIA